MTCCQLKELEKLGPKMKGIGTYHIPSLILTRSQSASTFSIPVCQGGPPVARRRRACPSRQDRLFELYGNTIFRDYMRHIR